MTTQSKTPPKVIEARDACPPLPRSIRDEIGKRTTIKPGEMTKSQVMNLLRRYGTSEVRKDHKLRQAVNLYDRCRSHWFK